MYSKMVYIIAKYNLTFIVNNLCYQNCLVFRIYIFVYGLLSVLQFHNVPYLFIFSGVFQLYRGFGKFFGIDGVFN